MELLYLLIERFLPERWRLKRISFDFSLLATILLLLLAFLFLLFALAVSLSGPKEIGSLEGELTACRIRKYASLDGLRVRETIYADFRIVGSPMQFVYTVEDPGDTTLFRDGSRAAIAFRKSRAFPEDHHTVYQVEAGGKKVGSARKAVESNRLHRTGLFLFAVVTGLVAFYFWRYRMGYRARKPIRPG